jgi:hypothetical protein
MVPRSLGRLISITSTLCARLSVPVSTNRKTHPIHDPPAGNDPTGHITSVRIPVNLWTLPRPPRSATISVTQRRRILEKCRVIENGKASKPEPPTSRAIENDDEVVRLHDDIEADRAIARRGDRVCFATQPFGSARRRSFSESALLGVVEQVGLIPLARIILEEHLDDDRDAVVAIARDVTSSLLQPQ